jgi:hypothetical protein
MWQAQGMPLSVPWLDLSPITVLYEFDGPRIFTCRDRTRGLFLAYQCGEDNGVMRYLVVPFSDEWERKLTTGQENLHDALMRPRAWLFDLDYTWTVIAGWQIEVENLPENCVPAPGVMLWPHLRSRITPVAARACASETEIPTFYLGNRPPTPLVLLPGAA